MTLQKVSQIFTKILLKALHNKLIHIVFSVIFLTLGTTFVFSQKNPTTNTVTLTKSEFEKVKDSTKIDTIKKKKPLRATQGLFALRQPAQWTITGICARVA